MINAVVTAKDVFAIIGAWFVISLVVCGVLALVAQRYHR